MPTGWRCSAIRAFPKTKPPPERPVLQAGALRVRTVTQKSGFLNHAILPVSIGAEHIALALIVQFIAQCGAGNNCISSGIAFVLSPRRSRGRAGAIFAQNSSLPKNTRPRPAMPEHGG